MRKRSRGRGRRWDGTVKTEGSEVNTHTEREDMSRAQAKKTHQETKFFERGESQRRSKGVHEREWRIVREEEEVRAHDQGKNNPAVHHFLLGIRIVLENNLPQGIKNLELFGIRQHGFV